MFTAAKNDAFVGAGSSVWVWVYLLQPQRLGSGSGEAKRRLLVLRVYPKTPVIKRTGLLVWGQPPHTHTYIYTLDLIDSLIMLFSPK